MLPLPVEHHRGALGETVAANVTHVGLDLSVSQIMNSEGCHAYEGFAANRAKIRFLDFVHALLVPRHVILFREFQVALVAAVQILVRLHVDIKILLRQQLLMADVTLELVVVQVHDSSMLVKRVLARVHSSACVAHMLGGSMGAQVELEVHFHFKALATVVAFEIVSSGVLPYLVGLEVVLRFSSVIAFVATKQIITAVVAMLVRMHVELVLGFEGLGTLGALENFAGRVLHFNVLLHLVSVAVLLMANFTTEATDLQLFIHQRLRRLFLNLQRLPLDFQLPFLALFRRLANIRLGIAETSQGYYFRWNQAFPLGSWPYQLFRHNFDRWFARVLLEFQGIRLRKFRGRSHSYPGYDALISEPT
jgi:hypothetical protein